MKTVGCDLLHSRMAVLQKRSDVLHFRFTKTGGRVPHSNGVYRCKLLKMIEMESMVGALDASEWREFAFKSRSKSIKNCSLVANDGGQAVALHEQKVIHHTKHQAACKTLVSDASSIIAKQAVIMCKCRTKYFPAQGLGGRAAEMQVRSAHTRRTSSRSRRLPYLPRRIRGWHSPGSTGHTSCEWFLPRRWPDWLLP
jgi:hypothetical protein